MSSRFRHHWACRSRSVGVPLSPPDINHILFWHASGSSTADADPDRPVRSKALGPNVNHSRDRVQCRIQWNIYAHRQPASLAWRRSSVKEGSDGRNQSRRCFYCVMCFPGENSELIGRPRRAILPGIPLPTTHQLIEFHHMFWPHRIGICNISKITPTKPAVRSNLRIVPPDQPFVADPDPGRAFPPISSAHTESHI